MVTLIEVMFYMCVMFYPSALLNQCAMLSIADLVRTQNITAWTLKTCRGAGGPHCYVWTLTLSRK